MVGGDGAGKSTAVDELHDWLSKDFAVIKRAPRQAAELDDIVGRQACLEAERSRADEGTVGLRRLARRVRREVDEPASFREVVRQVTIARDRYLLYRRARRFATGRRDRRQRSLPAFARSS